jgi:hypothetical protein
MRQETIKTCPIHHSSYVICNVLFGICVVFGHENRYVVNLAIRQPPSSVMPNSRETSGIPGLRDPKIADGCS